jgi:hypothetical protein
MPCHVVCGLESFGLAILGQWYLCRVQWLPAAVETGRLCKAKPLGTC